MSRFASYSGMVALLVLGAFIIAFSDRVAPSHSPAFVAPAASSTLFALPDIAGPPPASQTLDSKKGVGTAGSGYAAPASVSEKTASAARPPVSEPVSAATTPRAADSAALDISAAALRNALVNIICTVPAGSGLHSISGSGIFVDSKGIILTNAHIAQYFLLADRGVSCIIRSGSPAAVRYDARLLFISPAWIHANADILTEAAPSGTGEHDFAFLAVSGNATSAVSSPPFPFVPLATTPPPAGTPVVIASYGAQFLEPNQVQSALFPTLVFGSVKGVYTFGTNTIDVLALGGSAAAQEGSSGGGVADAAGNLVGTITTSTVQGSTTSRSLNAITASYIRADYASETGRALDLLLAGATSTEVSDFALKIPSLESVLTASLP